LIKTNFMQFSAKIYKLLLSN